MSCKLERNYAYLRQNPSLRRLKRMGLRMLRNSPLINLDIPIRPPNGHVPKPPLTPAPLLRARTGEGERREGYGSDCGGRVVDETTSVH